MTSKDLQVVDLNLEFSHICSVKDHIWNTEYIPKNFNEDTYDYEFQIKDVNDGDMKQYVDNGAPPPPNCSRVKFNIFGIISVNCSCRL